MKPRALAAILVAALSLPAVAADGSPVPGWNRSGPMLIESLSLHLDLASLTRAGPPRVVEGHLLLSAAGPWRFVGAAFAHEGYSVVHAFEKNSNGVFILALPLQPGMAGPLSYRLVVDGAWISDPSNPLGARVEGVETSLAEIPWISAERAGTYRILGDGRRARFLFRGRPGETVSVAGSFNGWDPFVNELVEGPRGVHTLELELPAGLQYYCFFARGDFFPDPLNLAKASSREGRVVSVLEVR